MFVYNHISTKQSLIFAYVLDCQLMIFMPSIFAASVNIFVCVCVCSSELLCGTREGQGAVAGVKDGSVHGEMQSFL